MLIKESPPQYYNAIPVAHPDDPPSDLCPPLARIKAYLGETMTLLAIGVALHELREWFNVRLNLTDTQIAMIGEMILDEYWDLTLADIKAVFREKMRTAHLYGALDGSMIMQWLDEYKRQTIEAAKRMREVSEPIEPSAGAVSFKEWIESKPEQERDNIRALFQNPVKTLTDEQQRAKEIEFLKYKAQYLKRSGIAHEL